MKKALLRLLRLMEKKYGRLEKLVLYDDGGGFILKDRVGSISIFSVKAHEFDFSSIDELIAHLTEPEELGEVQIGMGSGKD